MGYTYYYIPTDEGASHNISLKTLLPLEQIYNVPLGGREGSLVKHTKRGRVGVEEGGR